MRAVENRPYWMLLLGATLLAFCAAPAPAQSSPPEGDLEEVVVSGRRSPDSVIGDIPPEISLSSQEIRALGVGSVTELVAALGPQLGSSGGRGSGRPVVLLNGVRISGFAEVRDLPTEAIQRVDVFSEEVALRYGYRADQRVLNFVLRPRFRSVTADAGARGTTEGGREGTNVGVGVLRVQRDTRWQADFKARHDDRLLESERGIVGADGAPRPDAAYRTLLPAVDQLSINLVYARPWGEGLSGTVNATVDETRRRSLLGLRPSPQGGEVLRRDVDTRDAHLGGLLQGANAGWRWSAVLNADRTDAATRVGGGDLAGRSRSDSLDLELLAIGAPLQLPAGDLGLTVKAGLGTRGIESVARRVTGDVRTDLSRGQRDLRFNLDIPLLRTEDTDGRVTASLGHAIEDVAEVGVLSTTNVGLNASLGRKWRALLSVIDDENAPTMQQLGAAVIPTPSVQSYDFVRGEAVEIVRIDGGNPVLQADSRRIFKVALGARPLEDVDLDLNGEFTRSRLQGFITTVPFATPEFEQAFPGRFVRDPAGRLLSIDARPANLDGRERDELRFTVNLSRPWGPQPEMPTAPARGGTRNRDGASGGPPAGFNPAAMAERFLSVARRGSVQFTLVYTERLKDEVIIAPGLPKLDLLAGDTLSDTDGSPRRELEIQVGANRDGFGGRVIAKWREGSRITGGATAAGPVDLEFEPLWSVDLRLFADLGLQPWARDKAFLRGVRVTFAAENLFDELPQVRDAVGAVPLNYQPSLLDPQGRAIRLSFRKLFFPSFVPPVRDTR
jgi:hypothetical protein